MVIFRPDTSFPFLALARRCGVQYGYVLRLSEELKRMQVTEINAACDRSPLVASLVRIMDIEHQRRATVAHAALHTGESP